MKYIKPAAIAAALVLTLSACSHENPLSACSEQDAGTFLLQASQAAERQIETPHGGLMYSMCANKEQGASIADCKALYKAMASYAKTQKGYTGLTVADLQETTFWTTKAQKAYREAFLKSRGLM